MKELCTHIFTTVIVYFRQKGRFITIGYYVQCGGRQEGYPVVKTYAPIDLLFMM